MTQVDDSGLMKQADFIGIAQKDEEKSPYPAGKLRKSVEDRSSIPDGMSSDFFDDFRALSTRKEQKVG